MARCFLAISLPNAVKDRLVQLQPTTLPSVRSTGRDELHLTLHFLGEITTKERELVNQSLQSVHADPFSIEVSGVGQFPEKGPAQILWAGVKPPPGLIDLHRQLVAALREAIGYQSESRPYHPHITIARLKPFAPMHVVERFLDANQNFSALPFIVTEFALYSSDNSSGRSRYTVEQVFALRSK